MRGLVIQEPDGPFESEKVNSPTLSIRVGVFCSIKLVPSKLAMISAFYIRACGTPPPVTQRGDCQCRHETSLEDDLPLPDSSGLAGQPFTTEPAQ